MLRNKEIQRIIIILAVITTASVISGFIISKATGFLILGTCLLLICVFALFTRKRYKSLAQISDEIDLVLHSADALFISESEEGELAVLKSEINKLTVRISEQNLILQKEKDHLADSLADIAHQLRTPLTSVNLILSLLAGNPEAEEKKKLLRESEDLLSHMDRLLTSLLKLSRLDAGVVTFAHEVIDVKALVLACLQDFRIPMELRNIKTELRLPENIRISGDQGWLSEALGNIIKNSMESAQGGGTIWISAESNPLYTEILIRDSGKGFNADELPFLFERFYRGKSSDAAGYGIGLALCRMIITSQGGTVSAKNHFSGGALFTIRFPK